MRNATVGFVGAGQLARMTIPAAIALGIELRVLATRFNESAARVNVATLIGDPDNLDDIRALADSCDIATFDHELVAVDVLESLEEDGYRFAPNSGVLRVSQSKRLQRELFRELGLKVPAFLTGPQARSIGNIERTFAYPFMVKADRGGYDGRGVWSVASHAELVEVLGHLTDSKLDPVVEEQIAIDREVAMLIARSEKGETASYPLVETVQVDGMLAELVAPAGGDPRLESEAGQIALSIAESLDIVGLLAVELFESNGALFVNEIATRPHNSGHYTIEGCVTSQFEQHLRAVLGWPLGSTTMHRPHAATCNLVGAERPADTGAIGRLLADPDVRLHWYQKSSRPGRKLGHVTVLADERDVALRKARQAAERFSVQEADV